MQFLLTLFLIYGFAPALSGQESSDHRPVISPDGRTLAFMSDRSGVWAVYTMTVGRSDLRRVSNHPNGEWYPDWSPDGRYLVYHREPVEHAQPQLFIYDVEERTEKQLTHGDAENHYGRWAPSGGYIVFPSTRDGESDLYRIDVSGQNERRILAQPGRQGDPALSPDGRFLAYTSEMPDGSTEIFVRAVDGNDRPRQLTHHGSVCYGIDWSPDGGRIAFNTDGDGDHEIHVLDLASETDTQLTHNSTPDHLPRWLPNGEELIFTSEEHKGERIYTMNVSDGAAHMVHTGR